MEEFKWIKMSLFLIPLLHFTAAANRQFLLSSTVRDGDEVTLSCENVRDNQNNCDGTTWNFRYLRSMIVELVRLGQIGVNAKAKSDRLSVRENCSLVIKNVTEEDVGRYFCQQYNKAGRYQGQDSLVHLSVVTMTEEKNDDIVTLNCSVSTYERCKHTVKWLYEGKDVAKDHPNIETLQSDCYTTVKWQDPVNSVDPGLIYKPRSNLLKCEMTDRYTRSEVQLFPFIPPHSSREKPGKAKSATSETTRTSDKSPESVPTTTAISDPSTKLQAADATKTTTISPTSGTMSTSKEWWWLIVVSVAVAALIIITVAVLRWRRAKGKKTQMDDHMADPEGGVSYASISYTKKTKSRAQALGGDDDDDDDDEDDAVTCSTVKAPSSSAAAAASGDLSNL
ncbi:uncharacterized protein LOC120546851 isoform X2 [Perca fluviatilis]|uniref:uncharacterized protein LOC120546851 isoform X2 n=1 Tax=Perca fluviatilis TaxID=8168 RepID=UPI001962E6A4|nr:uncharacterized protein LOC120546851 isoform X2 [Perca fluviatilis]